MIEQQGRVSSLESGRASITLGAVSGCPACDAGKGCGAGVFGRLVQGKPLTLSLENQVELQPGQAVTVGIPEAVFLRLLVKLYLAPVLAGLAGAAMGHYLAFILSLENLAQDLLALTGALILAAVTLHFKKNSNYWAEGERMVQIRHCAGSETAEEFRQSCQSATD